MNTSQRRIDSAWTLQLDLLSAKLLVWFANVGRDAELTPQAHLYFSDRYRRLAEWHRARGRLAKARWLEAQAEEHREAAGGGDDEPPYAAAMAMPRPKEFIRTNAVSRTRVDGPDDAA